MAPSWEPIDLNPATNGMLDSIRSGLDSAESLPVGTTSVELGSYLRHATGITRGGAYAEISSHFAPSWAGFARGSVGFVQGGGRSDFEALAELGLRGYF